MVVIVTSTCRGRDDDGDDILLVLVVVDPMRSKKIRVRT